MDILLKHDWLGEDIVDKSELDYNEILSHRKLLAKANAYLQAIPENFQMKEYRELRAIVEYIKTIDLLYIEHPEARGDTNV